MGLIKKIIHEIKTTPNRPCCSHTSDDDIEKAFPGHKAQQERLDYQNKLLKEIGDAEAKYKTDGNIDEIIKAYEFAFVKSNPPCKSSQNLKLVDYYLKAGRRSDAWGYLNHLQITNEAPIEKILHEQARILKKEKKYIYAADAIMAEHLHKYSNIDNFSKASFIKDIGVCARALNWDESIQDDLADMLESQLKRKDYNDIELHLTYVEYLKSKELIEEDNYGQG